MFKRKADQDFVELEPKLKKRYEHVHIRGRLCYTNGNINRRGFLNRFCYFSGSRMTRGMLNMEQILEEIMKKTNKSFIWRREEEGRVSPKHKPSTSYKA